MKVINLDELERKCIEFGLKNGFFKESDLNKENLFRISLRGSYMSKTIDILFSYPNCIIGEDNRSDSIHLFTNKPITLKSETWEELYYQIEEFFRDYWNYIQDKEKLPLYMKINEKINKHSRNGYVKIADVFKEISKEL